MSAKRKEIPAYERQLEEARDHIQTEHYRSAVVSASLGIELLMLDLYDALIEKLRSRSDHAGVSNLKTAYDSCFKNRPASDESGGFNQWKEFYEHRNGLRKQLKREFPYNLDHFHGAQLRKIKDLRNKCSHAQEEQTDYQPSRNEAVFVCNHLALFLEETDRDPATRQDHEWTKDWHQEWDELIEIRLKQLNKKHRVQIVSALADQLRLVVDLIDDENVPGELKTQLIWAVTYVIEPDDFISEEYGNVPGLIDDAAVLALTLCWLDNDDRIDPAILREHWGREDDPIEVANKIYQDIAKNPSKYLNDKDWEIIRAIAKKGPRVLWQMPK